MGRRLARVRLQALTKLGEPLTRTAGAGIDNNIGEAIRIQAGREVISEFVIDLVASGKFILRLYGFEKFNNVVSGSLVNEI